MMRLTLLALATFTPFLATSFDTITSQNMTLDEKVGQVLMVHFNGDIANSESQTLIQELKIGGVIYYEWSNSLSSPCQINALSQSLQNQANETRLKIPLLITTDQEGGRISRLKNGFSKIPSNQEIGHSENPSLARTYANIIGIELKKVGINMNLAPVIDINLNSLNPVIGDRAYGNTPDIVTAFAKEALKGYAESHVIATLKHFPGHGDVDKDSHKDLPTINKSIEELEKTELKPFRELASQCDIIMTGHLLVQALDPDYCTTLSNKSLSYLRNEIGFKGLIISDSLVMEGVLKQCSSIEEVAIKALIAGCDIVLLGGKQLFESSKQMELTNNDIEKIHKAITQAVKEERISIDNLNNSVDKILLLKYKFISKNNL